MRDQSVGLSSKTISEAESSGSEERTRNLETELESVRQQYLVSEGENARLKALIEDMRSDNEQLQQKVVACRTGSPRPKSADATVRKQWTTLHSYKHPVRPFAFSLLVLLILDLLAYYYYYHYDRFMFVCSGLPG